MGLLRRRVPDGLAALLLLWLVVVVDSLLWDVADHRSTADERSSVELATVHAFSDDLPDGSLWQASGVCYSSVYLGGLSSLNQGRLQLHLNEVVVRDLVDEVGYQFLEDSDVPCPQLVQLVPIPVSHSSGLQRWGEAS